MKWYVTINGETIGPIQGETIIESAREGKLRAGAFVRDEAGGTWMPIEQSPFAAAVAAAAAGQRKPGDLTLGQGIMAVILMVCVGAFMVKACSSDSSSSSNSSSSYTPPKPAHDKMTAWVMAQQFVKDALKSPGSADFGSAFHDYQSPDDHVTDLGGGKYRARGYVDAQNGFGAKMRANFDVTLHYVGGPDGTWRMDAGPNLEER